MPNERNWKIAVTDILNNLRNTILGTAYSTGDIKATLNLTENLQKGWLLCNGAVISRTDYKDLWEFASDNLLVRDTEAIADPNTFEGLCFGPGDGSTTFSIPNLCGRYLMGASGSDLGTYKKEQLPNITGQQDGFCWLVKERNHTGAFFGPGDGYGITNFQDINGTSGYGFGFNASQSNSIYADNSSIHPLASNSYYVIKC